MEYELKNFQDELDILLKIDTKKRRFAFLEYCKKIIKETEKGKLKIGEASNRICGVCSLYFKQITPEFDEVMNIACDLELPDNYREMKLKDWEALKKIIADNMP